MNEEERYEVGGSNDDPPAWQNGLPPWHMWGNQNTVVQDGTISQSAQQLVKVAYKRPESWRFFLWAEPIFDLSAGGVIVDFEVLFGVGRAFARLPIVRLRWVAASTPGMKWVTEVPTPTLDDSLAVADRVSTRMNVIVAQDIQVTANVSRQTPLVATVNVGAFFVPNVHTRPDWFVDAFDGATGGK